MNMMAVRAGPGCGNQNMDKYYYGDCFQRSFPTYYTSSRQGPQPNRTGYPHANYRLANYYGYQQAASYSHNMSTLLDQDTKDYFFDLECPELTGSESSQSPTASSFTSGGSYAAPSPSQDAKDLSLGDHGISVYAPAGDLSPLSGFGDSGFTVESSAIWPEHAAISFSNPSSHFGSEVWPCSQHLFTQPSFGTAGHPTAMPAQSHSAGLYDFSTIPSMFPMAALPLPAPSVKSNLPMGFVDYGADGLVVPGHLFNTALDRCVFSDSNAALFNTQAMTGSTLELTTPVNNNKVELSPQPVQETPTSVPEVARNTKDEYLQEARRRGLSYKEIKRRGGFTEAESTLRGRIRILSKPKEMRVRKPQWNRTDIMLLVEAVEYFTEASQGASSRKTNIRHKGTSSSKLPWKKVAEWMLSHGASYPFAGATCAKKWEQIRDISF